MQGIIAAAGQVLITSDQLLYITDFAGKNYLIFSQADFFRFGGAFQRRQNNRFAGNGGQGLGVFQLPVVIQ